jgi:hypothetical protein
MPFLSNIANFRRHWPAEIITLRLFASVGPEKCRLLQRFHALCNDPQLETPGHADHRFHNGGIVAGELL